MHQLFISCFCSTAGENELDLTCGLIFSMLNVAARSDPGEKSAAGAM